MPEFQIVPAPETPECLARLTVGPERDPKTPREDWRPSGGADGVLWLGEKREYELNPAGPATPVITVPSAESLAYRYLRPMPALWRAHPHHAGRLGVCQPHGLPNFLADWARLARLAGGCGRPLRYLFCDDPHCRLILQTPRIHWRLYQVAPDVWALLYLGAPLAGD